MFQNLAQKNDKKESSSNLDKMESALFSLHMKHLPAAICHFLPIAKDKKYPQEELLVNEFLSKPIVEVFPFSRREIDHWAPASFFF